MIFSGISFHLLRPAQHFFKPCEMWDISDQ